MIEIKNGALSQKSFSFKLDDIIQARYNRGFHFLTRTIVWDNKNVNGITFEDESFKFQ